MQNKWVQIIIGVIAYFIVLALIIFSLLRNTKIPLTTFEIIAIQVLNVMFNIVGANTLKQYLFPDKNIKPAIRNTKSIFKSLTLIREKIHDFQLESSDPSSLATIDYMLEQITILADNTFFDWDDISPSGIVASVFRESINEIGKEV